MEQIQAACHHIDGPQKEAEDTEVTVALSWWTGLLLITQGAPRSYPSWEYISTQEVRCVPEAVSYTWCTVLDWRDSGPGEARSTVTSFHSTHHCSLQHCTPRNKDYIVQRKWKYFHFCCFKVSSFAHPPAVFCNKGGRLLPTQMTVACLLAAQTWAALVVFWGQQFNSHCWHFPFSVLPSCYFRTESPPSAAEENTEHRRSEQNAYFNP